MCEGGGGGGGELYAWGGGGIFHPQLLKPLLEHALKLNVVLHAQARDGLLALVPCAYVGGWVGACTSAWAAGSPNCSSQPEQATGQVLRVKM